MHNHTHTHKHNVNTNWDERVRLNPTPSVSGSAPTQLCPQYWPENGLHRLGSLQVEFVSADLEEDVISRIFRIYNTARVSGGGGATGSGWVEPQEMGIGEPVRSDWVERDYRKRVGIAKGK